MAVTHQLRSTGQRRPAMACSYTRPGIGLPEQRMRTAKHLTHMPHQRIYRHPSSINDPTPHPTHHFAAFAAGQAGGVPREHYRTAHTARLHNLAHGNAYARQYDPSMHIKLGAAAAVLSLCVGCSIDSAGAHPRDVGVGPDENPSEPGLGWCARGVGNAIVRIWERARVESDRTVSVSVRNSTIVTPRLALDSAGG